MTKVVIVQEVVKQYRVAFFDALHHQCERSGIELEVIYSPPSKENETKSDNATLPSEYGKIVSASRLLGGRLVYQHCLKDILKADLVIVEQANRPLINYLLIILSALGLKRFAFWGHGLNLQSTKPDGFKEKFKQSLTGRANWWFAYTNWTRQYLENKGYPKKNITNVNNSIDTKQLHQQLSGLSETQVRSFLNTHNVPSDANIACYCGSLYKEKCIPFLLESLSLAKQSTPDLYVIIMGAGENAPLVKEFCQSNPWCIYLGASFGDEKACALRVSKMLLNPGLVGLGIVDGFAAGLPTITTDFSHHSVEISYLKHNKNGVKTPFETDVYATTISNLFNDHQRLSSLQRNANESMKEFSIERMADNFFNGICNASRHEL